MLSLSLDLVTANTYGIVSIQQAWDLLNVASDSYLDLRGQFLAEPADYKDRFHRVDVAKALILHHVVECGRFAIREESRALHDCIIEGSGEMSAGDFDPAGLEKSRKFDDGERVPGAIVAALAMEYLFPQLESLAVALAKILVQVLYLGDQCVEQTLPVGKGECVAVAKVREVALGPRLVVIRSDVSEPRRHRSPLL